MSPRVTIQTSMGDIVLRLDHADAPVTVDNFLRYIREGHFDNTVFYRVVQGFVIQAGSIGADGFGRPAHDGIPLEANNGLKNVRGAISMARSSDPNSATAEFFIVLQTNPALDHQEGDTGNTTGYAAFGEVVDGMDVVDKIAAVPVGAPVGPFPDAAPQTPVIIRKVLIQK